MNKQTLKTMKGVVVSDKMDKTITVDVVRTTRHPVYRRVLKKHKKYKAHDGENKAKIGDLVTISLTRPISKTKRWRLVEVLK
ncbi:MAG: 30S ribosomal protein S17 [Candidatus Omnitrophota bacterium]